MRGLDEASKDAPVVRQAATRGPIGRYRTAKRPRHGRSAASTSSSSNPPGPSWLIIITRPGAAAVPIEDLLAQLFQHGPLGRLLRDGPDLGLQLGGDEGRVALCRTARVFGLALRPRSAAAVPSAGRVP